MELNSFETMFASCLEKQQKLELLFDNLSAESRYQKIIELGKSLPDFPREHQIQDYLVKGCQSITYLQAVYKDGKVFFNAGSEALISLGLAALLIAVYSDEPPEAILKCPPVFLDKLQIHSGLTPGRSNGLSSMYLRMKQEALKFLVSQNKTTISS